ncbi:MAG: SRPBCC domain-containing protein [Acidithiobacillus ferrooxidans]|nr:SRPBCC domain-containing protein [Acidithiobacillus ferrooxidans]MDD5004819.1 SRPBCC domain-containing protein [Acidithiobacillus sp.]MDD5379989.1 SRPBCC domain-containing protein [Acidithiobacillus sp.]MDD5576635.1 SRPBCC domain-containing protein [Acidithiobacillus sp.]
MYQIETDIEITASPERVWSILMDFPAYPQWNPFIRSLSGVAKPGEKLRATIQPEERRAMTFRPRVLKAANQQELRWLGHLGFPGLFDGEHYFQLTMIGNGYARFTQGEQFSGILVGMFVSSMGAVTKAGFHAMNQALKNRAEANDHIGHAHDDISKEWY